jgi:hypothetical protein
MASLGKEAGAAVVGLAGGAAGVVLSLSAFVTPFVVAGWIADAITSSWFFRVLVMGVVLTIFFTIGMPLVMMLCRPPDAEQIARGEIELVTRATWRKGWVARALAVIFLVYGVWKFPDLMSMYADEASARLSVSDANLYGILMALQGFTAGTLLMSAAFLLGSAFTRGAPREITTLVFLGAWVASIVAGVVAGRLWNPNWGLYRLSVNTAAVRSLWAVLLWGLAAWRLRAAYKVRPGAAERVVAA